MLLARASAAFAEAEGVVGAVCGAATEVAADPLAQLLKDPLRTVAHVAARSSLKNGALVVVLGALAIGHRSTERHNTGRTHTR